MRYTVKFKLYGEEVDEYMEFCKLIALPPERVAKQALFYAIADARRRGEEMELARLEEAARYTPPDTAETANDTREPGNTGSNMEENTGNSGTSSVLANQEATAADTKAE